MMSNITVDGFCKMKHSLQNWWIKNSWTFWDWRFSFLTASSMKNSVIWT